ncbi:MAG TPA: phosphatidylserine/phosphatidylglycerophosphate/cardiolipin synthase family protein [Kofleriaceae bacterium]|jgi:cardiolipin synthase
MVTAARPRAKTEVPGPGPGGLRERISKKQRARQVQLPPSLARYARSKIGWRTNCDLTVLREGGETYPAMLAAIASAKRSICFETYILEADQTGDRFRDALVERARAGVSVRLIYDAVGSIALPGHWVENLRREKIEVVSFNPIRAWRRKWAFSHRDHRKILVVDDAVAFTGGLNISNDYATVADGGEGWHDMHCRVHGAVVTDLARMFRRTWLVLGGSDYPAPPLAHPTVPGTGAAATGGFVRLLDNTRRKQRSAVRATYLHVIRQARTSLLLENAYFLPDRGLRRALVRAVQRGVRVCVIAPGHSDVRLVEYASLYVMRRLAGYGVQILRWRGPMMHAKTATVDGAWSTIGSYNFDAQSRFRNLEVTLEILDAQIAAEMVQQFERDRTNCEEFSAESWGHLPWWKKGLAWLAYRFRRFL